MRRPLLAFLILTLFLIEGAAAQAPPTRADLAYRKLGRGLSNFLFCVGEFARQSEIVWSEKGYGEGFMEAFARGTGWSLARFGAGIYEILTFPFGGGNNFAPVIEPEWVFEGVGQPEP